MLELKVTVVTPDLTKAINNLALAIGLKNDSGNDNNSQLAGVPTNPATTESAIEKNIAPTQPTTPTTVTTAPVPTAPAQSTVPTSTPQYTLEMIAKAGTALVDAGRINELTALLARYGVEALTSLDPAQYGSIAMELRNLGAQI